MNLFFSGIQISVAIDGGKNEISFLPVLKQGMLNTTMYMDHRYHQRSLNNLSIPKP